MRLMDRTHVLACAGLLIGGGCAGHGGAAEDGLPERTVGRIDSTLSTPLVAPDTVRAGRTFTVTVTTLGSSSCTRPAGAMVTMRGDTAEIVPYDRVRGGICTDDLAPIPRAVTLRFARPGRAVVRVRAHGVAFQRIVVVRP